MPNERRYVLRPFAKRRYPDREDVQSIVQVGAEMRIPHLDVEVAVRRANETNIHFDGARASQAFELLLLQHTKKLYLRVERQLPHLVHEQRALVRELEAPDPTL